MSIVCLNSLTSPLPISPRVKPQILPLTYKFLFHLRSSSAHTHRRASLPLDYFIPTTLASSNRPCFLPPLSLCMCSFLRPEYTSSRCSRGSLPTIFDLYKATFWWGLLLPLCFSVSRSYFLLSFLVVLSYHVTYYIHHAFTEVIFCFPILEWTL